MIDKYINSNNSDLQLLAVSKSSLYRNASPFPSIEFNDFFNPEFLDLVLNEFPDLSVINSEKFNDSVQQKYAGIGESSFGEKTKELMYFLNSESFLKFLQTLTGIKEPLISDPYFIGGGQHEIKKGGLLKIHADFNKHSILKLDRRLNVIIYLNKKWREEYGGHLELWDKKMKHCVKKITPAFNTMAIFSTSHFSYHGHPDPLDCPPNMSRKSLALYYYSNGRPNEEIYKGTEYKTLFKKRIGDKDDKTAFSERKVDYKSEAISFLIDLTPPIFLRGIKYIIRAIK